MQCVNAHWVPTAHLPLSNSQPRRSITPTRSQFPKTSNPNHSDGNARESESSAAPAAAVHLPSHVKSITSTSNPFVKHCVKLRLSSSYRHQHRSVLVVGSTPIRSILFEFYLVFFLFLWFYVGIFPLIELGLSSYLSLGIELQAHEF